VNYRSATEEIKDERMEGQMGSTDVKKKEVDR